MQVYYYVKEKLKETNIPGYPFTEANHCEI